MHGSVWCSPNCITYCMSINGAASPLVFHEITASPTMSDEGAPAHTWRRPVHFGRPRPCRRCVAAGDDASRSSKRLRSGEGAGEERPSSRCGAVGVAKVWPKKVALVTWLSPRPPTPSHIPLSQKSATTEECIYVFVRTVLWGLKCGRWEVEWGQLSRAFQAARVAVFFVHHVAPWPPPCHGQRPARPRCEDTHGRRG